MSKTKEFVAKQHKGGSISQSGPILMLALFPDILFVFGTEHPYIHWCLRALLTSDQVKEAKCRPFHPLVEKVKHDSFVLSTHHCHIKRICNRKTNLNKISRRGIAHICYPIKGQKMLVWIPYHRRTSEGNLTSVYLQNVFDKKEVPFTKHTG